MQEKVVDKNITVTLFNKEECIAVVFQDDS